MTITPISPVEIPLGQGWRFAPDPDDCGENLGWQAADYEASPWMPVSVPHSWNNIEIYASFEGIAWYRLAFDPPAQATEACTHLRFDAVFYLADVWLNGEYLGKHEGGYTPFEFEVSKLIRPEAENILAVRVDNRRLTDRIPAHLFEGRSYGWNNYGGIVRDVKLAVTSKVFVKSVQVNAAPVLTAMDHADRANVSVQAFIQNIAPDGFSGELSLDVFEETSGARVASSVKEIDLLPGRTAEPSFEVSFQDPLLWHFDHPHLYRCDLTLSDRNRNEYDRKTTIFGVREVGWEDGQFRLNGEAVRLVGLSRHADVPGYGLAETRQVMTADFADLKTLNMVIGRPVHYPQHETIYDYCDRMGILLSPELPAWQLTAGQMADEHIRALARQQLREMIVAARNHPCIWAWSVGNELETDTMAGRAFIQEMVETVKSIDPTRPVGFASYHLLVGRPWADATRHSDFVMMNQYFGTWHGPKDSLSTALDTIHLTWPDKMVVVSEFGFYPHWQRIEGPAIIDPNQYYHIPEHLPSDSLEADIQREKVIREQMTAFRSRQFVSAAIFWNYRGDMGVVDDSGRPRQSWHTLQEAFAPLVIEGVDFTGLDEDRLIAHVKLRTRGPIEADLPAYTLRDYRIKWQALSLADEKPDAGGEVSLPVLTPGTTHELAIEVPKMEKQGELHISVIRPTGFHVIDQRYSFSL